MLRQLAPSLWVDEVPFKLIGINFGNRMTIIRLKDGTLWLHSPTRFNVTTQQTIKKEGEIHYLVTPSLMHNLFVMKWKKEEPQAQLFSPEKAKRVEADNKLDEISEQAINQCFKEEISCIPIHGIPTIQEYAFIHHDSKTLILTDLAFNFGNEAKGWSKLFLKLYGAYNKFGPTITIRALIKDKAAFKESLNIILEKEFERIIVSHGHVIEENGKQIFREAFKRFIN